MDNISNIQLLVITAMLEECYADNSDTQEFLVKMIGEFNVERDQRYLYKIDLDEDIRPRDICKNPPPICFDNCTDDEVRIFYAIGAEIADFSCLGKGVRDYVENVWLGAEKELKSRGIEKEFLDELKIKVNTY